MIAKCFASLVFVLILLTSGVCAQTGNQSTSPSKSNTPVEFATKTSRSKEDEMREHQLRVFREHVLARALDNVKKMDEAGLRISARNQILTYLTSEKAPSSEKQILTTQLALDSLSDLRDHGEEIDPFMLSYLSNHLRSWLQKHRPSLTEDFDRAIRDKLKSEASQHIRSLFDLEGGDVLAVKRIRQELEAQGSLNSLHFWLDELLKRNSSEFEPLASEIALRAGRGQLSFETLFWVSTIYLRPEVSRTVRNRFLTSVVARTQGANFVAEPAPQMALDLLVQILPFVQQSIPELYDQALNQSVAIRASLNQKQLVSEERIRRLKDSANPIEVLLAEADSAKSKTESNELLLQAAELALEKKRFELSLDILSKLDVNVSDSDSWQRTIDQFLRNFVKTVLVNKHTELAAKAAARITSPLSRVEALSLIMRYSAKTNDKDEAQKFLVEAARVAGSTSDDTAKAKAFFHLSLTCDQVDNSKKADFLLSGIKALNDLAKPKISARDVTVYQRYVQRLDNVGHELVRGFTALTKQDESEALALVEKLQKPDLRPFGLIGILLGLDGLLTQPAN